MIKLRISQMTIEMPKEQSEPWIRVVVQRIEKIGGRVNTVDRWDSFHYRLSDIADKQIPSQREEEHNMISGLEIATHLTVMATVWLLEKYGGKINAQGELIIED